MEVLVRGLSSPVKRKVIGNIGNLSNASESSRVFSNSVVIGYLKKIMYTNRVEFYKTLLNMFGEELLVNESFMSWLYPQLTSRSGRLKAQIYESINNNYTSKRGRKHGLLTKEDKQKICSYWTENSIQSTDRRNGESSVRISKMQYLQDLGDIEGGSELKEVKSKKGKIFIQAEKRIASCTVRKLTQKLKNKKNIDVQPSTAQRCKPFFAGVATDRELQLCMCKLCLNTKLLLDKFCSQANADDEELDYSISNFLMKSDRY